MGVTSLPAVRLVFSLRQERVEAGFSKKLFRNCFKERGKDKLLLSASVFFLLARQ
jgi:hypothetical protein